VGCDLSKRVSFEGPLEPVEPAGKPAAEVVGAPPKEQRGRGAYFAVAGVLFAVMFAGLWLNARSDLNDARAKLAKSEAEAKARLVAPNRPDLLSVAENEFAATSVDIQGDANSVWITIRPPRTLDQSLALRTMLRRLGFDYAAVSATLSGTRDPGGGSTASAQDRSVSASWTYGPGGLLRIAFVVV
jgi:hypothetical protein